MDEIVAIFTTDNWPKIQIQKANIPTRKVYRIHDGKVAQKLH